MTDPTDSAGVVLAGWERGSFTAAGLTRDTYRRGTGPGVIVVHEIPGITPKVTQFANDVVDAGFTVVMPSLVGTPGTTRLLHAPE
jgi:dienelactone hydrolase